MNLFWVFFSLFAVLTISCPPEKRLSRGFAVFDILQYKKLLTCLACCQHHTRIVSKVVCCLRGNYNTLQWLLVKIGAVATTNIMTHWVNGNVLRYAGRSMVNGQNKK